MKNKPIIKSGNNQTKTGDISPYALQEMNYVSLTAINAEGYDNHIMKQIAVIRCFESNAIIGLKLFDKNIYPGKITTTDAFIELYKNLGPKIKEKNEREIGRFFIKNKIKPPIFLRGHLLKNLSKSKHG